MALNNKIQDDIVGELEETSEFEDYPNKSEMVVYQRQHTNFADLGFGFPVTPVYDSEINTQSNDDDDFSSKDV